MALYQNITITDAGAEVISGIIMNGGSPLTFEAVAVGSGQLTEGATPARFTGLIAEAKRLPIESVTRIGSIITVTARLATDTLQADLYHREIGIYANGVLLAYGNTGEQYDYIPTAGKNAAVQKIIRVPLSIGTMQTSFAEMDTTDLVSHAALRMRMEEYMPGLVGDQLSDLLTKGGGTIEAQISVDQSYSPQSDHAQSGTAVAEAVSQATSSAKQDLNLHANNTEIHLSGNERAGIFGGIYSTGAVTTTIQQYNGFTIKDSIIPRGQKIKSVSVLISGVAANSSNAEMFTTVYAAAYAKEGDAFGNGGTYTLLGVSENAVTVAKGEEATWTFAEGITVPEGMHLRIALAASRDYITESSVTTLPNITIWVYCSSRSSAYEGDISADFELQGHIEDDSRHVSEQDRAKWDKPINAYRLLADREDITEIPSDMDLSNVIFAFEMAVNNKALKSIAGLNMKSCLNAYGAFFNCPALETIDGVNFVLCKDCYYMFAYDTALRIIGNAGFDYAENTQEMFRQCAIESTGTSTFTYARNTRFMFAECKHLEDITSMGLMWIIDADGMFTGCILNLASVKHIADNLRAVYNGRITIGINAELQGNAELATALETIRGKGWTVIEEYNTKTA